MRSVQKMSKKGYLLFISASPIQEIIPHRHRQPWSTVESSTVRPVHPIWRGKDNRKHSVRGGSMIRMMCERR
jgi:hypothetical protein